MISAPILLHITGAAISSSYIATLAVCITAVGLLSLSAEFSREVRRVLMGGAVAMGLAWSIILYEVYCSTPWWWTDIACW